MNELVKNKKTLPTTGGLAQWRQYPRRNDSANLEVTTPQKV